MIPEAEGPRVVSVATGVGNPSIPLRPARGSRRSRLAFVGCLHTLPDSRILDRAAASRDQLADEVVGALGVGSADLANTEEVGGKNGAGPAVVIRLRRGLVEVAVGGLEDTLADEAFGALALAAALAGARRLSALKADAGERVAVEGRITPNHVPGRPIIRIVGNGDGVLFVGGDGQTALAGVFILAADENERPYEWRDPE